jgi:ATP phosphoribosyltransferase
MFSSDQVEVFFLRPWDLPLLVEGGRLDAAFCGTDVVSELQLEVNICHEFDQYRAPLAFCTKVGENLDHLSQLVVATEYPRITEGFLRKRGRRYTILRVQGACEAYPHLQGVSAIVDIVETGETLRANGLEVLEIADFTSPCLVQNRQLTSDRERGWMEWRHLIAEALP